jgi:CARDB
MKKLLMSSLIVAGTVATAIAQTPNPSIPKNVTRGNQLPTPKIKQLKQVPDLSIVLQDVISASYSTESRITSIKVSIKITNTGTATSPASIVAFDVYTHDLEGRLDPDRKFWQQFGESFSIPALSPGSSITRFATFQGLHLVKGVSYRSHLSVNPYGAFEEVSNLNNQSAEFSITVN